MNFAAGPTGLPEEVLRQAQDELLNWRGLGMSLMEISHRSDEFRALIQEVCGDLRSLLRIPEGYHIFATQGGARLQFAMLPMNFMDSQESVAEYLVTGFWGSLAAKEAELHGRVSTLSLGDPRSHFDVSRLDPSLLNQEARYVHITSNETIDGVQWHQAPEVGSIPLVADMSSDICSRPIDLNPFALIYACAQKTLGIAGVTFVIIRDDLVSKARRDLPTMLRYDQHVAHDSVLNTSPTYPIYMSGLILKWMLREGGLEHFAKINEQKASLLYRAIDASDLYENSVPSGSRSLMNVPFTLQDESKTKLFLEKAYQAGFRGIKGHRMKGGIRVSLYNAVTLEMVERLVEFMHDFER